MSKNFKKNRKFKVNKKLFKSKTFWFIFLFTLLIILILIDTFTKIYIKDNFKYSPSDFSYGNYTHNSGFAFGKGSNIDFKYQIIIYVILFFIIFCYFIFSFKTIKIESFGLIFILSGISNFINKLWNDKNVIDFIPVKLFGKPPTCANVADIFVIIGVSFILLQLCFDLIMFFIRRNAKKN